MVEAAVRDAYQSAGHALLTGLVTPAQLNDLVSALTLATSRHQRPGRAAYAARDLLALPAVAAWVRCAPVQAVVAALLAPGAAAISAVLFDKQPEANWRVPWHQDLTAPLRARLDLPGWVLWSIKDGRPHVRLPDLHSVQRLALRLHLDDCGADNAPLEVLPGSHRDGPLEADGIQRWCARVPRSFLTAARGEVLAVHPLLLHASAPALAPGQRRVLHVEWCAAPLPPGLAWADADEVAP